MQLLSNTDEARDHGHSGLILDTGWYVMMFLISKGTVHPGNGQVQGIVGRQVAGRLPGHKHER